MSHTAFVVIDIQNDYFPGGALPLHQVEEAAQNAGAALAHARKTGLPVIVVQHLALDPAASFFRPNTVGAAIHPDFQPQAPEEHLVKHHANAFRATNLQERLASMGIDSLVISGMMTHMCIDSTVRAAADSGYHVTLLEDATATRALSYNDLQVPATAVQIAVLAALSGSFATVVSTAEWTG